MKRLLTLVAVTSFIAGCSCCGGRGPNAASDRFVVNNQNVAITGWMSGGQVLVEACIKPQDGSGSIHDITLVNADGGRLPPGQWKDCTPQYDEGYVGHALHNGITPVWFDGSRWDYYNQYYTSIPPRMVKAWYQPVIPEDITNGQMVVTLFQVSREQVEVTTLVFAMELAPGATGKQRIRFAMKEPPETRTFQILDFQ